MSSAVQSLQKAIVADNQPLTQLLRQAKLIAAKLGVADVEKWVDSELNGYPKDIDPPRYRTVFSPRLEYHNGYRGGWQFAGHVESALKVRQPIAEVENLSLEEGVYFPVTMNFPLRDDGGDSFGSDWPQRLVVSGSQYKSVIEAVKNELLQWTIELEKRGIKGEDMDFNEKEKQLATNVHIEKFAGVFGNVINSQVAVNDYGSICKMLIDQQVPTAARRELEDILEALQKAPAEKKQSLIARAEKWLTTHGETLGAGAEIVGKFIKGLSGEHH